MVYQQVRKEDVAHILGMLGTIYPVSKELSAAFYEKTVYLEISRGETLVEGGTHCQYMYFIKKGALMGQTIHKEKQIVTYISIENEFVSSISGLHGVVPSQEAVIAVEDCQLLGMHNDDLQELFLKHFDMNFLFRVMVEKYYRDAQERTHIIRLGNAQERYLYFINAKPGYIERLPLHLVASLLDMKLPTLLKVQKQYQLSLQKDRQTEEWCKKIEDYIVGRQAYKMPEISIEKVAEVLSISTHKLSAIFNNTYQLTFADFVNRYRIGDIQQYMTDKNVMHNYTIEALAKKSGFASRSAFYSAFKKMTGMSPSEYLNSL